MQQDRVTLPVQFCRDREIFDFQAVGKNWDTITTDNDNARRWRRTNDPDSKREYVLQEIVTLPVPAAQALPKNASLTRDVVAGISALYLLDNPTDDILRGKLVSRILEVIGMQYSGRAYDDVQNILTTLSCYRVVNQLLYRYNAKTKKTEEYRATFGFVNDYLRKPGESGYEYEMQVNRIYADLLASNLPRANMPRETLIHINNNLRPRVITPAKNIAYALAAQRNYKSVKYKADTLNNIAGYQSNKPSRVIRQVTPLLDVLQPTLIQDYKVDKNNNIIIDITPM